MPIAYDYTDAEICLGDDDFHVEEHGIVRQKWWEGRNELYNGTQLVGNSANFVAVAAQSKMLREVVSMMDTWK